MAIALNSIRYDVDLWTNLFMPAFVVIVVVWVVSVKVECA